MTKMNWGEKTQEGIGEESLADMTRLTNRLFHIGVEKAQLEKMKKELNVEKTALERTLYSALEAQGLRSFRSDKANIFFKNVTSCKLVDPGAFKEAVGEDVWDSLASINSKTMGTWFKAEKAKAEDEGDYDYQLNGVEYTEFVQLGMRKA